MKKVLWALAIIAVIVIVVISSRTGSSMGSLKISTIIPLSGLGAFYGEELKNGMELANVGHKLDIIHEDSATNPALGASAMSKIMAGANKDLVVVAFSSVARAVTPMAEGAKIPTLQTIVSASKIAAQSPYIFRYFTSGEQEAPIDADIAVKNLNAKKIAIIYSNDEYGLSYYNAFKERVESYGIKLVSEEMYGSSDTDFRSQLTKIGSYNPEVIYIVTMNKGMPTILKQIKDLNIKSALLTNWVLEPQSVRDQVGALAEGVYFTTSAFDLENGTTTLTKKFETDYEQVYRKKPSAYAAIGYDVVNILSQVQKSEADTGLDIVNKIKQLKDIKGVMGDIIINSDKEITFKLYPAQIRNGKIVTFDLK